jgi:hypothetical protein
VRTFAWSGILQGLLIPQVAKKEGKRKGKDGERRTQLLLLQSSSCASVLTSLLSISARVTKIYHSCWVL